MSPAPGARTVEEYLSARVEAGEIPGAAWAVAGPEGILQEGAAGDAVVLPERIAAAPSTIYDLASLTKPLVTSFLFLKLGEDLGLTPGAPARRYLPELDRIDKRDITLEHLLTHTSGLPAWAPFYARGTTAGEYLLQIRELSPEARPGVRVIYSDVGYIALGEILRRCASVPLDALAREEIFGPLELTCTAFKPPRAWVPRVAATEESCNYERGLAASLADGYAGWREGVIRAEVHDQNAWVLGGVSGHAGLFSTARETAIISLEYLGTRGSRGLLDEEAVRFAREDRTPGLEEARSLAFRIASRGETAAGPALPPETFGHNGFTGTSVWIDPVRPRVYVLLTNRVHPAVSDRADMLALRRGFHSVASKI
ncbi:MAG TPA: serine hydrolase domain-containing protein [Candidatus Polarisedimenticolia bacterium]